MLTQLRLPFHRLSIPIRPVLVMPRELKRQQRVEVRKLNARKRELYAALEALQMPLIPDHWMPNIRREDRSDVEKALETVGPNVVAVGPEVDDVIEWEHDDIVTIHSYLLEESLKALAAKGNPSEKLDVLDWIFEPDFFAEVVVDTPDGPRKKTLKSDQRPFSFAFTCKIEGHDPAFYRAFLRRQLPDVVNSRYLYVAEEDSPTLQDGLRKHCSPYLY